MRFSYRLLGILITAFFCISFIGCRKETPKIRIGVSQCSDDDWRRKMNEEILREAMFHDGVEVEIRSANDNSLQQIEDLQYYVDNKFDIIVVAPNEAETLTPVISDIYDKGIPVIVFDRSVNNNKYTAFQGADNLEIGHIAAQYAATLPVKPVQLIEIRGLEGSTPARFRHKGLIDLADSLNINILGFGKGNWNYEDAKVAVDSLLMLYPQTNVIYAHNDRMALGAAAVIDSLGRDDIYIIGVDAAPTIGVQAVLDDKIDVTILYPTNGDQLVKTAIDIVEGRPYEANNVISIPTPVTKSNAEFILMQDKALRKETAKISVLQKTANTFMKQATMSRTIIIGSLVIIALSAVVIFLLMRYYWSSQRHKAHMEESNATLARQRDELDQLYHQLQEATGSKLAWFTNVSHDLRTPLTLISDPVHQLAQANNLTNQQRMLMQLADKNVKRLQRLVNQILDIRKYDNGQLKLHLTKINLGESLLNWTSFFIEHARKHHIKIVTDIPDDTKITLALDVEKTERIVFNLLSNAFKFTPENGTITVSLRQEGDNAVIKVKDTGIGIPADEINHIMERFFRTETINPNGSGIGLALSKVFVEMQGGTISVESQVNVGSVFTLTFPMLHTGNANIPLQVAESTIDPSEIDEIEDAEIEISEDLPTVLIIDDNHDICTLLRSELSGEYTVISAYNGPQGIKLATKYVPDLIICDVMMPGMDGYEVCRRIKNEEITSHIPILLLTACGLDEQRIEGYNSGADAYMPKPFETSMLLARCNSLIANRRIIYDKGNIKPMRDADALKASNATDGFVARFTKVVESELTNPDITVESLAQLMGVSRVQLYRKIKATTNYSVSEFIRIIRLKRATVLLKTTDTTVSEASYAVGFPSPNYFTRCYKDYFGELPSETHARIFKGK